MCWLIRNTKQEPKYERLMRELEATNKAASRYLKQIDKTKWTLLYDRGMRRWGNLTTNISKCMNNVLRGSRMLPIQALIEYTFKRDVDQYAKNYNTALTCLKNFPGRMWNVFRQRDIIAREHQV
ncbi:hypothetical protein QVD17_07240 [Tagetes erecta]|uniref:Uncharacterized protein n=1 Tax=Tagetes erecta TaxID=13708 RepID=A0AAD8P7B0_TARER|nr:hypothetical protein QVD17_07240 [Tagetes erecta]